MSLVKNSRKFHKWLMLFLGIQFLIWTISGAYMVILNIDYIHGDTLVVNHQSTIDVGQVNYPLSAVIKAYPEAKNIELSLFIEQVVYRFKLGKDIFMLDANHGQVLSPLSESKAIAAAKHYYSGKGELKSVELISDNPPFELSRRALPAWRVDFVDFANPSLYISATSGKLVTKRHQFWRIFDLMFSLHVMDYEEEDPSNLLLLFFSLFSLISVLAGLILTYFRFFKAKASLSSINSMDDSTKESV